MKYLLLAIIFVMMMVGGCGPKELAPDPQAQYTTYIELLNKYLALDAENKNLKTQIAILQATPKPAPALAPVAPKPVDNSQALAEAANTRMENLGLKSQIKQLEGEKAKLRADATTARGELSTMNLKYLQLSRQHDNLVEELQTLKEK